MSTMQQSLKGLRECTQDARAIYYRYRQRQINALHNAIASNKDDFIQAIQQDTAKSAFEAELELLQVLKGLQLHHKATEFQTLTDRVITLRKGGEIPVAMGAAFILGHWTAPLATSILPLAAAIVAGNVALTLIPEQSKGTYKLLGEYVKPMLDHDAFPIHLATSSNLQEALQHSYQVYSATSTERDVRRQVAEAAFSNEAPCHLLPVSSKSSAQNICLVSKTTPRSDLSRVARLIARSKFCALAGQGLGAVSFVCVHEEVHDELVKHLVEAVREFTNSPGAFSQPTVTFDGSDVHKRSGSAKVVAGDFTPSAPTILEKVDVFSSLLDEAIAGLVLPVVPFTSTEAALNVIQPRLGSLLAVFGDQLEIDYFVTELRPSLVAANEIPLNYLVSIHPAGNSEGIWPVDNFERVISVDTPQSKVDSSISPPYASWQLEALRKAYLPSAAQALRIKLKPHANTIRRVFFLQGLFLSLSLVLGSTASVGGFFLYRWLRTRF